MESWEKYKVGYAPRVGKNGWSIQNFDIDENDWQRLRYQIQGRDCGFGENFTRLVHNGEIWMSDTKAEVLGHAPILNKMFWTAHEETSVLINGLGLGVIVNAALLHNVSRIDVVEIDQDVIDLVGPEFQDNPEVHIHHGSAFDIKWPVGTGWTYAWHDIWVGISDDNLPEMHTLHRRYGSRVLWQGSWERARCEAMREQFNRGYNYGRRLFA